MKVEKHVLQLHPPGEKRALVSDMDFTVRFEPGVGGYVHWLWRRRSYSVHFMTDEYASSRKEN